MLQPVMDVLNAKKIVLASSSQSRQEIIKNIGLKVDIRPSSFEENLDPKAFPGFSEFVEETALRKVLEVEDTLKKKGITPDIIIGADTVVTLEGIMYGKPSTAEEAFRTLSRLSGTTHTVFTGVIVKSVGKLVRFTVTCDVTFGKLTDEQIRAYIDIGEPMDGAYAVPTTKNYASELSALGIIAEVNPTAVQWRFSLWGNRLLDHGVPYARNKAGSYGIQGLGGTFVQKVEGDYFAVMGLPQHKLCAVLYELVNQ